MNTNLRKLAWLLLVAAAVAIPIAARADVSGGTIAPLPWNSANIATRFNRIASRDNANLGAAKDRRPLLVTLSHPIYPRHVDPVPGPRHKVGPERLPHRHFLMAYPG